MSPSPQVPTPEDALDLKTISRKAARRRIAIACGATAGVTFILAGLLAAPGVLPGVLDELRDRELLPVHIIGGGGTGSSGQSGSSGSSDSSGEAGSSDSPTTGSTSPGGSPGSSTPRAPGAPASESDSPPPSIILPGGVNLSDILDGTVDNTKDTVDNVKQFADETIEGGKEVLGNPNPDTVTGFIDDTLNGAEGLLNDTTSTIPGTEGSAPQIDVPDTSPLSPVTSLLEPVGQVAPTPAPTTLLPADPATLLPVDPTTTLPTSGLPL